MGRDAYAIWERKTVIFWSRKAGNTSLAEWLVEYLAPDQDFNGDSMSARRLLKKHANILIQADEALDLVCKGGFEDYILARNPYRRAVSAYVEKFVYYGSEPLDQIERLRPFAAAAYREALVLRNLQSELAGYAGLSFIQFLEYIASKVRKPAKHGEPGLNYHWNTQVPFFFDGKFTYRNIIRLEEVDDQIRPLARALDCEIPFPHSRSNAPRARIENEADLSEASSVELIRTGIVPGARSLLSAKARQLIQEAYEIDFRMLGYNAEE